MATKLSGRTVKAMKAHSEAMCRRIVFHRAEIVEGDPRCERCLSAPATDWAHIIPRRYSVTRCHEDNAWALCRPCHERVDKWIDQKLALVDATMARGRYEELQRMADAGLSGLGITAYRWWSTEVDRLKARCEELGLDTRVKAR